MAKDLRYVGIMMGTGTTTDALTTTTIDLPRGEATMAEEETTVVIEEGFGREDLHKRNAAYSTNGSVSSKVDVNSLAVFFAALVGKDGYTYDSASQKHTFALTNSYTPQLFALLLGTDIKEFRFDNCALTSLGLNVEDGAVEASYEISGGKFSLKPIRALADLNRLSKLPLMFHEVSLSLDGVELQKVKSLSLDINQNTESETTLSTRFKDLRHGKAEISGSFSRNFTDTTLLERYWGNTTSGGGNVEQSNFSLEIDMIRHNGEGSIKITLPNTYFTKVAPNASGRESAVEEIEFKSLASESGSGLLVEITNDLPAIFTN